MVEALFPAKRRKLFGSSVDLLTMDETLAAVEGIITARRPTQHVVINVAKLILMRQDLKLMDIVNSCPIINADGQGIVWGGRWLGLPIPERVTGVDLFSRLMKLADQKNYKTYFLGARQRVVERVVEIFRGDYPGMTIAGYRNGYYQPSEIGSIVEDIRRSGADMLFVAISSPQKEFFLNEHLQSLGIPFVMGVGGSFDIIAGQTMRAPVWMQKAGLEWFFRLLNEPRRMMGRYLSTNFAFLILLMKALIFGKEKYGCR